MQKAVIIIPCYNEERRLNESEFLPLLARDSTQLVFVDDGSRDRTAVLLQAIAARGGPRVGTLALSVNSGKAEAVRRGMLHALAGGAHVVGYTDADASTPARELLRLLDALFAREADVVMGARVQLLGSAVRRRRSRHYLGRIFATAASVLLDLPVYDTQCGAKFFRDSPALRQALVAPFASRWAFDVELLGRLLTGSEGVAPVAREKFLEVPLSEWSDVAGSKLDASAMLKSGLELAAIGRELRRKRQRLGRG